MGFWIGISAELEIGHFSLFDRNCKTSVLQTWAQPQPNFSGALWFVFRLNHSARATEVLSSYQKMFARDEYLVRSSRAAAKLLHHKDTKNTKGHKVI